MTDGPDASEIGDVMHVLGVRGLVPRRTLADIGGDQALDALADLVARGWAVAGGRGVRLTSEGRAVHATRARLPTGSDVEQAVERLYRSFLPLNEELLGATSAWQVRPGGAPNDHDDAAYDRVVIGRLGALDDRTGPVLRRLTAAVVRFGDYRPRLAFARTAFEAGRTEWICSPREDSYHTVWMQLHEDLLLALGSERP